MHEVTLAILAEALVVLFIALAGVLIVKHPHVITAVIGAAS